MTALQFALFFAALIFGFIVVFVRIARTDHLLQELRRLASIDGRLESIQSAIKEIGVPSGIAEVLAEIRQDLASAVARCDRPVTIERPEPPRSEGSERVPGELLRDRIEARLYSMGYQQVRILTDLKDAGLLDACKVTIECQREEIGHKGTLTLRNGSIIEMRLLPVLQVFP